MIFRSFSITIDSNAILTIVLYLLTPLLFVYKYYSYFKPFLNKTIDLRSFYLRLVLIILFTLFVLMAITSAISPQLKLYSVTLFMCFIVLMLFLGNVLQPKNIRSLYYLMIVSIVLTLHMYLQSLSFDINIIYFSSFFALGMLSYIYLFSFKNDEQ